MKKPTPAAIAAPPARPPVQTQRLPAMVDVSIEALPSSSEARMIKMMIMATS